MDRVEARELLAAELAAFRVKPYEALARMVGAEPVVHELIGPSGAQYQVEIQACWDHRPDGDVRVLGSIDDGGLRAFFPLTDDFIKSRSGDFLGKGPPGVRRLHLTAEETAGQDEV